MKQVTQTVTGPKGDCLRACVASILELELEMVPELSVNADSDQRWDWFVKLNNWLQNTRGLNLMYMDYDSGTTPLGYSILVVDSPRHDDVYHALVAYDGFVKWDPYPGDEVGPYGDFRFWLVFQKLDPSFDGALKG